MPKVSRDTAQVEQHGPVEDRHAELDGYTVNFVSFAQPMDTVRLLEDLPGGNCPCPHWGYVFKGKLTFRVGDRDEVYGPGDAFYVPPGHHQFVEAGTEYLQFSPTAELRVVSDELVKKMAAAQGA